MPTSLNSGIQWWFENRLKLFCYHISKDNFECIFPLNTNRNIWLSLFYFLSFSFPFYVSHSFTFHCSFSYFSLLKAIAYVLIIDAFFKYHCINFFIICLVYFSINYPLFLCLRLWCVVLLGLYNSTSSFLSSG